MDTLDFEQATTAVAALVAGVRDNQLGDPTPCTGRSVADLLDHIAGFPTAFTAAARKQRLDPELASPRADGANLAADFRARIARDLAELAEAWRDPAAYDGMTQAGPVDLPGNVAALVALDEVVVHGWDLARATGQEYDPGEAAAAACLGFAQSFEPPAEDDDGSLFGRPVPVPDDAPTLDRLAGATGRDPHWTPPAA
jgi:uncharacterized protein (TIGR03086 family)